MKVSTVTKEVVPDVTTQTFWLKNCKCDEWRDKHDMDLGSNVTFNYVIPGEGRQRKELRGMKSQAGSEAGVFYRQNCLYIVIFSLFLNENDCNWR